MDVFERRVPRGEVGAYCHIDEKLELRQGELLSNITFYKNNRKVDDYSNVHTGVGIIERAIIATPDCDLLQDFKSRRDGKESKLFCVLMFGVENADATKKRIQYGTKEWPHVVQNEIDRFYFLGAIAPDEDLIQEGIPDSVVDFKMYFTLPPGEIYNQFGYPDPHRARRRCRLSDLWREDFQRRAMSYMQRVGLPDPADER